MVVLDILMIIGSLVVVLARAVRRRRGRTTPPPDGPVRVLTWVIAVLPAGRADWGRAMSGELGQIERRSQRWRFVLGCLGAAALLPIRRAGADRLTVILVGAAAAAAAALVAFGLVRYPAILAGPGVWSALGAFAAVLAGLTLLALLLVRRGAPTPVALVGGLAVAAVWIVCGYVAVTYGPARPIFSFFLLMLPAAPLAVGVAAAGRGRSGADGRRAALLAAVVAGLVLFVALASDALLTAGGPYDAGQLRDFPGSRFPDIASYAVNDNLGTAMSLLLLASIVTAVLGCAAATTTALIRRAAAAR